MKTSFHNNKLPKRRYEVFLKKIRRYRTRVLKLLVKPDYLVHESSLAIAGDKRYQSSFKKSLSAFKGVEHVFLVGIGGSSLGTEAVYQALAYKTSPTLTVFDQIDREALQEFESQLNSVTDLTRIAVVVVSKSGTTTETMLNAVKLLEIGEKKFGSKFNTRVLFVGNKGTAFQRIAKKKTIPCITLPDAIVGRYSVFSAVGIVPLTLLGMDVTSFCEGAVAATEKGALKQCEENAIHLALYAEEGVHTVNFFTFNTRLETCGLWYRQLLAESIGKNMTTKGASFSHQLLPIVSNAADLHSMTELYLGGYKNIYSLFYYFDDNHPYHLLLRHWLLEHMPFLAGKNIEQVKSAIVESVLRAYDDQKLPYRYTRLDKCTAYEIGFLLASLMYEVMCLAHLLNIDAFNQPSVELYKKHTRSLLLQ